MMRSWHLTKPSLSKAPFIQMDKKRISQTLSSWQPHLWQSPQLAHSVAAVVNTHLQSSSGLTAKLSGKSRGAPHTHSPQDGGPHPGGTSATSPEAPHHHRPKLTGSSLLAVCIPSFSRNETSKRGQKIHQPVSKQGSHSPQPESPSLILSGILSIFNHRVRERLMFINM